MARGNGKTPENLKNLESLGSIVDRMVLLFQEQESLRAEIKEVAGLAWEPYGISAKAIKQLAKEKRMGEVAREARRQYEEQLATARAQLGMLLDTPLGQAAMSEAAVENNNWDEGAPIETVSLPKKKARSDAKGTQRKKAAKAKKGTGGASKQLDEWL